MNFKTLSLLLPIIGASYVDVAYGMDDEERRHVILRLQEETNKLVSNSEDTLAQTVVLHNKINHCSDQIDEIKTSIERMNLSIGTLEEGAADNRAQLRQLDKKVEALMEKLNDPVVVEKIKNMDESTKAHLRDKLNAIKNQTSL